MVLSPTPKTIMVPLRLLFALFVLSLAEEHGSEMNTSANQDAVVKPQEKTSSHINDTFLKPITDEMSHIWTELTNSTPVTIPHDEYPQIYAWNYAAVVVAALLVLLPLCCCGGCAISHYHQQTFSEILPRRADYSLLPEVSADLTKVLRSEVLLMLACPALALIAGPWTTCAEGCPNWIYVLYLPILFRSKFVEYQLMKSLNGEWTCSTLLAFLVWGPLDHMDWFSDGIAPVQALACDLQGADISNRFAAWATRSAAWWSAPVVQSFHVWGLFFLAFCVAAAAQQMLASVLSRTPGNDAVRADFAGMLGLTELSSRASYDSDKAGRFVAVGLAKVVLENVPQLLLQTSFFALVFDELTLLGRAKVLFSILVGLLSASHKILEAIGALVKEICRRPPKDSGDCCFLSMYSAIFMLASVAVLWTVVKLYFVFHCETRLWDLGRGCVEWN